MLTLRNLWRYGAVLLSLLVGLLLLPVGFVGFWLWRALPERQAGDRSRRVLGIVHRAFRLLVRWGEWLGLWRFELHGLEALPDGPAVIVANHTTLLDTVSVVAAVPRTVSVVKPSIWQRRWLLRGLFETAAYIESAGGMGGVERMMDDAVDRLRRGFRVLIFPEGTRGLGEALMPFGRTAFEIACRADVPVVPVAIHCAPLWLGKDRGLLDPPPSTPHLTFTMLPAVRPVDHKRSSRALRDAIYGALNRHVVPHPGSGSPPSDR